MKRMMAVLVAMVWLAGLALCQGCLPAAIGYAAYKMSDAKTDAAEKEQRSKDLATYANYRVEMEKVNLERQKAGLKPNPIMTQEEWIGAQTAGRPAITPAADTPAPATPAKPTAPENEAKK
jgi:hypothetical protein